MEVLSKRQLDDIKKEAVSEKEMTLKELFEYPWDEDTVAMPVYISGPGWGQVSVYNLEKSKNTFWNWVDKIHHCRLSVLSCCVYDDKYVFIDTTIDRMIDVDKETFSNITGEELARQVTDFFDSLMILNNMIDFSSVKNRNTAEE